MWWAADLEIRNDGGGGSRRLSGSIPYNETATLRSSGRVRKERFEPGAWSWSVNGGGKDREINLLVGHSYSQPLASRNAGTLKLTDTDEALRFSATLPPAAVSPTYVEDAIKQIQAGLATGVSVGFQVPAAIKGAEKLIPEEGSDDGVLIRSIRQAVLFEVSVAVTRPAYKSASAKLGKRSMEPAVRRIQQERLAWL